MKLSKEAWHNIRVAAEYIAIIVLAVHLLPADLVEKGRENGLAAIIFFGIICILLIISNWNDSKKHQIALKNNQRNLDSLNVNLKSLNCELQTAIQKGKYRFFFPFLNTAFSKMHDMIRSQKTEPEYRAAFQEFCTQISLAFKALDGDNYHVCIKIPIKLGSNNRKIAKLKARTLVRGSIGGNRENVDNQLIEHLFNHNTDYEHIFNNIHSTEGRYFISNNLPQMIDYKNSSFQMKSGATYQYSREAESKGEWILPYKSCITAAICPGISSQRNADTLIGFLCIDYPEIDGFIDPVDPEIIAGCADGLYNPLKTYIETQILKKQTHGK